VRALGVAATIALIVALIGCGSKPKAVVDEPDETGPLSAAEKLAQTIRDNGSLWWTHNGECRRWELLAEIDDDEGLLGIARRLEESGGQKRTVTYKISVGADGLVSAIGPSVTTTSTLGRTSTGGSATCTNQFGSAAYINDNGGVRLTSKAGGGSDKVLDERWYFTEQACQTGRGAAVTNGCAR
jgi:hypothetical protein